MYLEGWTALNDHVASQNQAAVFSMRENLAHWRCVCSYCVPHPQSVAAMALCEWVHGSGGAAPCWKRPSTHGRTTQCRQLS